ncbi:hypothetical protein D918_00627 [Trichuris suis]|nr:hypothetical protein D918_00627 [Trichuris suis]
MSSDEYEDDKLAFSITRIRNIMKSSPEIGSISHDAVVTMAKCTELFIESLLRSAYDKRTDPKVVMYDDVAAANLSQAKSECEIYQILKSFSKNDYVHMSRFLLRLMLVKESKCRCKLIFLRINEASIGIRSVLPAEVMA